VAGKPFPILGDFCAASAAAAADIDVTDEPVCALCDVFIQLERSDAPVLYIRHGGAPPTDEELAAFSPPSDLHRDLCTYYTTTDPDADAGWALCLLSPSPDAHEVPEGEQCSAFRCCAQCSSKHDASPPRAAKWAIASGMWMGCSRVLIAKTPALADLTEAEWNLCKLFVCRTVWRFFWKDDGTPAARNIIGRGGFSGHALHAYGDPDAVAKYMTSLPSTFDDRVLVHLTGGFSSQEKAARRHYVRIRRVAVAAAIAWLQGNNPIYTNVPTNAERLDALPDDSALPGTVIEVIPLDVPPADLTTAESNAALASVTVEAGCLTLMFDHRLDGDRLEAAAAAGDDDGDGNEVVDVVDPDEPDTGGPAHVGPGPVPAQSAPHHAWYKSQGYAKMHEKSAWVRAFTELYPHGRGHPSDPGFRFPVSLESYVKRSLLLSHRSFAQHSGFILTACDVRRTSSAMRPMMMKARVNADAILNVTAPEATAAIAMKVAAMKGKTVDFSTLSASADAFLKTIEAGRAAMLGTAEESRRERFQICALFRKFGSPLAWCTVSPNDARTLSSLILAGLTPEGAADMPIADREALIAGNAVASAAAFERVLNAIVRHIFKYDIETSTATGIGTFGEVAAFVIAVEEQYRGTLHGHMIIWIRGVPTTLAALLQDLTAGPGSLHDTATFADEEDPGYRESRTDAGAGAPHRLVDLMSRACVTTNYLPAAGLPCSACGAPCNPVPLPTALSEMTKAAPKGSVPDPVTSRCGACSLGSTAAEAVARYITPTLGGSHTADHQEFGHSDSPAPEPAGIPAGIAVLRLSEESLRRCADRAHEFQQHSHEHTQSCFKTRPGCRYGFPHSDEAAHISIHWTEAGAAKPLTDRASHDIDTIEFVPERAASCAYTNRHNPAILMAGPLNSDFAITMATPGLTHYIAGYASKSQDANTPAKMGQNALAGFLRAVAINERKNLSTGAPQAAERLQQAKHRVAATLADSTRSMVIMAPMAARFLIYGSRFIHSHKFSMVSVIDLVNWAQGDGSVTAQVQQTTSEVDGAVIETTLSVTHFTLRGHLLHALSAYEVSANYVHSPLTDKAEKTFATVVTEGPNAVDRSLATGEPLRARLPQHVQYLDGHRQRSTHCLTLRPKPFVPRAIMKSLAHPEAVARATADEPDLLSDALHYLALYSHWGGAYGQTTLIGDSAAVSTTASPGAIIERFRSFIADDDGPLCRTKHARTLMEHDSSNIETRRTHQAPRSNAPFTAADADDFSDMAGAADPEAVLANDFALLADPIAKDLDVTACNALRAMTAAAAAAGPALLTRAAALQPRPAEWVLCCHCGGPMAPAVDEAAAAAATAPGPNVCSNAACLLHRIDISGELRDEDAAPFATLVPPGPAPGTPAGGGLAAAAAAAHPPTIQELVDELAVAGRSGASASAAAGGCGVLQECIEDPTGDGSTDGLNEKQRQALIVLVAALFRGGGGSDELGAEVPTPVGLDEICERITRSGTDPLLMAFLGEGGTGKSFVLLALRRYAERAGLSKRILWTASSGSAASLIGAWTFHSAFHLRGREDKAGKTSKKKVKQTDAAVRDAWLIIVEEISMISKQLLGTGSEQCQALTGFDRPGVAASFWAGKSCVICGDFFQLPPPGGDPLYDNSGGKSAGKNRRGTQIIAATNCAVILTETMRTQDPDLKAVLGALRSGVFDAHVQSLIQSRTFLNGEDGGLPATATHIASRNAAVNNINQTASALLAQIAGQPCVRILCQAAAKGSKPLSDGAQAAADLYNESSHHDNYIAAGQESDGLTAVLDTFVGQKVKVRAGNSLLRSIGFGNNTHTSVLGYADADGQFIRHDDPAHRKLVTLRNGTEITVFIPPGIEYVIVRAETLIQFRYRGLPPNAIAVKRSKVSVPGTSFALAQFPMRGSAACTDYAAQGRTLRDGVSVDCDMSKRKSYVAASRALALTNVVFTRRINFQKARVDCAPNEQLARQMAVFGALDDTTRAAVRLMLP
jgi:hypothetical protein